MGSMDVYDGKWMRWVVIYVLCKVAVAAGSCGKQWRRGDMVVESEEGKLPLIGEIIDQWQCRSLSLSFDCL